MAVPEDPPPEGTPSTPTGPDVDMGRDDVSLADGTRVTDTIVGQITDQARRTRYDMKLWMRDLEEGAAYLPK